MAADAANKKRKKNGAGAGGGGGGGGGGGADAGGGGGAALAAGGDGSVGVAAVHMLKAGRGETSAMGAAPGGAMGKKRKRGKLVVAPPGGSSRMS